MHCTTDNVRFTSTPAGRNAQKTGYSHRARSGNPTGPVRRPARPIAQSGARSLMRFPPLRGRDIFRSWGGSNFAPSTGALMVHDLETAETSPPTIESTRSAAALRMQRYRARRRKGLRCLLIELREVEIDQFVRRKRLSAGDRENPEALRRTLREYLHDTLW
jgi:hypothetical protein